MARNANSGFVYEVRAEYYERKALQKTFRRWRAVPRRPKMWVWDEADGERALRLLQAGEDENGGGKPQL